MLPMRCANNQTSEPEELQIQRYSHYYDYPFLPDPNISYPYYAAPSYAMTEESPELHGMQERYVPKRNEFIEWSNHYPMDPAEYYEVQADPGSYSQRIQDSQDEFQSKVIL